ncbi:MAG TPA: AMP-binding protein, partial [Bryobacteraceae bacterium]
MPIEPARAFAGLLRDHGPLDFDVEEWFLAFKLAPVLKERFRCWMSGAGLIGAHGQAVEAFIREERHREVPAYKNHRDCKSSSQFPFLDKQDLRAGGQKFVPEALLSTQLWVKSTSGTTGRPVPIYYSPEFHFESFFLTVRKIAALAAASYDGREVYCAAITDNRECKPFAYPDPCRQVGHFLQTILDGTDSESTRRVLDSLADLRPFCVTVKPSILEVLVEYRRNRPDRNFHRPPVLVCSGANLTDALRQNAEAILGVPVCNAYGLTECGIIASECEFHAGLHIWDPDVVVTIVDESGACVPESVAGEIVVSSVRNAAFPLLRYRTGDLGTLT